MDFDDTGAAEPIKHWIIFSSDAQTLIDDVQVIYEGLSTILAEMFQGEIGFSFNESTFPELDKRIPLAFNNYLSVALGAPLLGTSVERLINGDLKINIDLDHSLSNLLKNNRGLASPQ